MSQPISLRGGYAMNLDADRMLLITIVDAIKQEMSNLREWYFYEPKHTEFNALYYDFLFEVNQDSTLEEQVEVCHKYYKKMIEFLNEFYPQSPVDVDILDIVEKQVNQSAKQKKKPKKRGRPKGSKNKSKG